MGKTTIDTVSALSVSSEEYHAAAPSAEERAFATGEALRPAPHWSAKIRALYVRLGRSRSETMRRLDLHSNNVFLDALSGETTEGMTKYLQTRLELS